MHGCDLPLEKEVADREAPVRDTAPELECDELELANRIGAATGPSVDAEPEPAVTDDEDRVERRQPDQPPAGRACRDDEKGFGAPYAEPETVPSENPPRPSATSHSRL